MWLPTNDDTKTILYDTKFLKSSPGRYPAIKWSITKIEDTAVEGISMFTMAQAQFDPAKDNVELGIADYWESAVEPELPELEEKPTISDLEITYTGSPAVRAGGGFKKFILKERVNGELVNVTDDVEWSVNDIDITTTIDEPEQKIAFGANGGELICSDIYLDNYSGVLVNDEKIFRVKCTNDYSLIGKTFAVTAKTEHSSKSLIVEVTSL
jgi:hypothetical protein